jgi:hypothetical protein
MKRLVHKKIMGKDGKYFLEHDELRCMLEEGVAHGFK